MSSITTEKFDFDRIIPRRDTGAIKADSLIDAFGREDVIPLWIADMDFATPACILDAIRKRCDHPVLGYTKPLAGYYESVIGWLQKRHGWSVARENVGFVSGIVPGLAFCLKAFTKPGDKVLIQTPVYPPFHNLTKNNERELITNPLIIKEGCFQIDFDDFERKLEGVSLFILCNPHNPGGRVWSPDELRRMAEICYRKGVLVISDEIHCDLVLNGHTHTPFASVCMEARENSVTLMAPSKTFNMAGLSSSFHIIFNEEIKRQLNRYLQGSELANGHLFAFCATEAAYRNGEEWLNQALLYMQESVDYVIDFLNKNTPGIKAMVPQASFLIWLDCRELGLSRRELVSFFVDEAGLALNDGTAFGKEGEGFMRINIGTPRSVLRKAMEQLKSAYEKRNFNF